MTKYCDNCQRDVEAGVVTRSTNYQFKGESFDIQEQVLICECGEDLYDEILDTQTMHLLKTLYEERIGLSLDEIKNIRNQFGLSMNIFAKVLGWSKSTILRYETGKYIPSSAHLNILKQLLQRPETIMDFYESNSSSLNPTEQIKVQQCIKNYDNKIAEDSLNKFIDFNYLSTEKTIQSGYKSFDINKTINMILYFTQNAVPKTKLMKLLFYSDFLCFKRYTLSISGIPYEKHQFGPVPKDHDILLASIEKKDFISIDEQRVNDYLYKNISAKDSFDNSLFTQEEIDTMNFVNKYFLSYTSTSISDFSHLEKGWIETEHREVIAYDYAGELQLN